MGQDEIYRVLLELKETAGKTEAGIDDIKKAIVDQAIKQDKLEDRHNALELSHNTIKTKVGLFSFIFGTVSGAITALTIRIFS